MRRFIASFCVTLGVALALFAVEPIRHAGSVLWVYGSLIALGILASLVGRGLSGLLAFYLGYGAAHLLAIGLGLFLPPGEGEVLERLVLHVYASLVGTVGYLWTRPRPLPPPPEPLATRLRRLPSPPVRRRPGPHGLRPRAWRGCSRRSGPSACSPSPR